MRIGRSDGKPLPGSAAPGQPAQGAPTPASKAKQPRPGGGDAFQRTPTAELPDEAPFWLLAWQRDRRAGRLVLRPGARREAGGLEQTWIATWAAAAPPGPADEPVPLAAWQAWVEALVASSGVAAAAPQVVWQPALPAGRGQFLFRATRPLLQLRPGAPGSAADWRGTVAHETFHHVQHGLVAALYKGEPLAPPFAALATYYRDAAIAYRSLSPACPAPEHRRQDLEVGAWAFGAAVKDRSGQG